MKRIFDIVVAALGLVITSPIMFACMIWIRLDSPGPGLLRQERVGHNELPFICVKLRTMYKNTRVVASHHSSATSVTKAGRFLRRAKLDELPQLWNVLRGEMSLVGPRPCLTTQAELIAARHARGVQEMVPGITGVAQVAGVDMSNPERLAELDATYRPSLVGDLKLILQTVMGAGRGDRVKA